ncbi:MAG: gamma-glutamyl-phosphate reductase, partial [Sphingomonadaceae bacterium]|nr:gamma-glutamyl-phosphate reductase [Sphingomonadaceae bacterium]
MTISSILITDLTAKARIAARYLAGVDDAVKAAALTRAAQALRDGMAEILAANAKDVDAAVAAGISPAMLDRLKLDAARVASMASAVEVVATLADPVGQIIDTRTRPNGLMMERVRVPVGVLGIIYESRPNVTADAAALGLRSGNA